MSNRLNDIFSNDSFNIGGKLRFKDDESYKAFLAALEIVQAEGKVVSLEGIASISTEISDETGKYLITHSENISEFMVGPSKEKINIPVIIEGKEHQIPFYRYGITDNVVLESPNNSIVFFKILFCISKQRLSITYKSNFSNADSVIELIENYSCASAFLTSIVGSKERISASEEEESFFNLIDHFKYSESFFKRLHAVETELNIQISPLNINNMTPEIQNDIEEIYILLCEKKPIRLNAKLTLSDSTIINDQSEKDKKLVIGTDVKITFLGDNTYNLFDEKITLKTANLLVNAIIKDIQEDTDLTKILYGDTDNKPMYVSYSAFKTEEEAKKELGLIMNHEDKYVHALTLDKYIKS